MLQMKQKKLVGTPPLSLFFHPPGAYIGLSKIYKDEKNLTKRAQVAQ